jgi:hypothetical protein
MDDPRHIDAARLGERFEARRDIDAVAEDVTVLGDDVAEIDADAHRDALLGHQRRVFLRHRVAQAGGASRRLDDTVEFDQCQIAYVLEDISAVFAGQRHDDLGQNRFQLGDPVNLVARQQPAVAGHEDCR